MRYRSRSTFILYVPQNNLHIMMIYYLSLYFHCLRLIVFFSQRSSEIVNRSKNLEREFSHHNFVLHVNFGFHKLFTQFSVTRVLLTKTYIITNKKILIPLIGITFQIPWNCVIDENCRPEIEKWIQELNRGMSSLIL